MRRELAPLSGRVELRWYNRDVIRRNSERRSKSSASQRHLLAPDECRCGRGCARGQNALNRLSSVANAPIFST